MLHFLPIYYTGKYMYTNYVNTSKKKNLAP